MKQTYSEYKDTNIPWLSEIPSHWRLLPCRAIVENQVEKNDGAEIQEYLSLMANVGVIRYEDKGDVGNKKPDDLAKCKIVRRGNLVINSMNYAIGSYGMSPYYGVCSPVYIVLEPNEKIVERRFALRLFENKPMQKHLALLGNGILEHRAAIKWADIKPQYVPVPPLEEQKAILDFLDRETGRIDNLIADKQTVINLLKEKRQALISHVVTKGLNPNVRMKDSGVEWIGQVPEHWGQGKIKYIARISNGATPNRDTTEFWEGGTVGWLNSSKVNDVCIESADQFITELAVEKTSVQPVKPNDLVMAITGEGQTRGRVAICKTHTTINQHLAAISVTSKQINVEYLFFWLTSQYTRIRYESSGAGSTKGAITCTDIGGYPVPMPPKSEQEQIVSAVKEKLFVHDALLAEIEGSLELLREHRTALISAVVTGKIDVRNYKEEAA